MAGGVVVSSPVAGDFNDDGTQDFAYLTDQGRAVAISAAEGRVWQLWDNAELGKVDYASPTLIVSNAQPLLVFATQAGVSALHAGTGRMAWTSRLGATYIASPLGLAVSDRRSHDVAVVAAQGQVRLLSGSSGDEIWSMDVGREIQASPAGFDFTADGLPDILVQTVDGRMVVIDSQRGRAVLETELTGARGISASPLLADLTRDGLLEVSVVDDSGNVRVLSMNRTVREGRAPWPRMLGNDTHSVAR
jgi:outer membrane protein assembly factor BamB